TSSLACIGRGGENRRRAPRYSPPFAPGGAPVPAGADTATLQNLHENFAGLHVSAVACSGPKYWFDRSCAGFASLVKRDSFAALSPTRANMQTPRPERIQTIAGLLLRKRNSRSSATAQAAELLLRYRTRNSIRSPERVALPKQ